MDHQKLEQAIMQLWSTKEDLMLLAKKYGDHPEPMTEDEVINAILGIAAVHELRCDEAFNTFKQTFALDEWAWLSQTWEDK